MIPCKTGDLDPVTTLVAPLVFAVGREVDVSGHLRLEPEGSLVLRVQDFLGESWPLYLLLRAPGSPCHLKRHVVGHQGVFHPCEAKAKSLRSVPAVPCSPWTSLQPELALPILPSCTPASEHWLLPVRAVTVLQLHCAVTVHRVHLSMAVRLYACLTQATPRCGRHHHPQGLSPSAKGKRGASSQCRRTGLLPSTSTV